MGIIEDWGLTPDELNAVLAERPSVRGILVGFLSEYKLQRGIFTDARIHRLRRYDDHDRKRPADFSFEYQGENITVEVKSLQTSSVRRTNGGYTGRCQVDASDKRPVSLPDGSRLATTCLLIGTFDVLAVNLFEFGQQWRFSFVRNQDLPRSTFGKYTEYQRRNLLASSVRVHWPIEPPFVDDPFPLLDQIVRERRNQKRTRSPR
jgi:hypothetical protein